MSYTNQLTTIAALVIISILYEKFKAGDPWGDHSKHYELVKKYLLTKDTHKRQHLPIIWIHVSTEINARWWPSFNSRNTTCLNQPYQHITIKSVIKKCKNDFNICVINDKSFSTLVPNWSVDLDTIAEPMRSNMRKVAIAKILYVFGGIYIPSSFLCIHSLKDLYEEGISGSGMFAGEVLENVSNEISQPCLPPLLPSTEFMGCEMNNPIMKEYIYFMENITRSDYTATSEFLGEENIWIWNKSKEKKIKLVRGELLGTRKACTSIITIDELLGDSFIDLDNNCVGIYIPQHKILRRTAYQWFARLSEEQLLKSNTFIGKQCLINMN